MADQKFIKPSGTGHLQDQLPTLDNLGDVEVTSPTDRYVLEYDVSSSTFKPAGTTKYVRVRTQAQFDAITSASAGTEFRIEPTMTYVVSSSMEIPAGVSIVGVGGEKPLIEMPDSTNDQVFRVGGTNTRIANLRINHLGNPSTASIAILVYGSQDDVLIEGCEMTGFWNCFQATGTDINNKIKNLKLVNCYASSFNEAWYGYLFDYVENLEAISCRAYECGADGFKTANGCLNIKMLGGDYSRCGMTTTPGVNGQGADLFSGGDTVIVDGVSFRGNGVNTPVGGGGLLLKSSTGSGSATTGYMKKITIANCVLEDSIGGANLVVFTEPVVPAVPLLQAATIVGNVISGGDEVGVRLGGANINFSGNVIRTAANDGVLVDAKSVRTIISNNTFIANSFGNVNSYHSLTILGSQVLVDGNVFDGKLNEDATDKSEIDSATAYPNRHVYATGASADNIRVTDNNIYSGSVSSIPVRFTNTVGAGCMWDSTDTILPNSGGRYGSPGSTYRRHNAITDETLFWVKPIGSAVDNPFGWVERYKFDAQLTDIGLLKDVDTTTTPPVDGNLLAWVNANSAWEPLDSTTLDHGSFTGLGDDDHTIYFLADGSRDITGSFNVEAPNAVVKVGDGTGTPMIVLSKSNGGESSFVFHDIAVKRAEVAMSGNEHIEFRRFNVSEVQQGVWLKLWASGSVTFDEANGVDITAGPLSVAGLGTFDTNVILNSGSPTLTIGNGSGIPTLFLNSGDTSDNRIMFQDNGSDRWLLEVDGSTEVFRIARYNSTGVFQDYPFTIAQSDGDVTIAGAGDLYVNNLIRLNSANGSAIIGNGSGDPNITFRKGNTDSADIHWSTDSGSGLNNHWSLNFGAVEDITFQRRNADGTANDSPLRLDWSDGNIYVANDIEVSGSANVYGDDADALNVRTQTTGFVETQLKKKTKGVQSGSIGISGTFDVATLGTISTNGQNMKFRVWVTGVDNAVNTNVSSAVIEQMAYRSSGTVTLVAAHRNDKQGNGTFNTDAAWSLLVSGDDVILRFTNTSNSDSYTVNFAVEWETQEGGFSS